MRGVSIPFSSGHSVNGRFGLGFGFGFGVSIPFSSGHSVNLRRPSPNTRNPSLHPFFIRSLRKLAQANGVFHQTGVSIPFSSGHSVNEALAKHPKPEPEGLHPFFIRSLRKFVGVGVSVPEGGLHPFFIRALRKSHL